MLKENKEEQKKIIQYLDSLVTTINPNINAAIPERHICQKGQEEIIDDLQDYVKLINKLQRHTRCNPSYYIHTNRNKQQIC